MFMYVRDRQKTRKPVQPRYYNTQYNVYILAILNIFIPVSSDVTLFEAHTFN